MESPSISRPDKLRGLVLMELLVAIALIALIGGLGFYLSTDVLRGTTFRSTRQVLVSALTLARSRALANLDQSPYGVCYLAPDFIVFKGTIYDAASSWNDRIPGNAGVTLTSAGPAGFFTCGTGAGIVFSQIAATTSSTGSITVTEGGHPDATVSVNSEGTIIW